MPTDPSDAKNARDSSFKQANIRGAEYKKALKNLDALRGADQPSIKPEDRIDDFDVSFFWDICQAFKNDPDIDMYVGKQINDLLQWIDKQNEIIDLSSNETTSDMFQS